LCPCAVDSYISAIGWRTALPLNLYAESLGVVQTGEGWFQSQSEDVQRSMMPSRGAYAAWESGQVTLSDFIGERHDPVWGTSVYQRSWREVVAEVDIGSQRSVFQITSELAAMSPGSSVNVGPVHDALRLHWPEEFQKPIHIQARTRAYYQHGHPWTRDHEDEVVRAIRNPTMIRLDAKQSNRRAVFYREFSDGSAVLVVVQRMPGGAPYNRVVTAFDVLPMEIARRRKTERLVWRKVGG